ncbi:D-isomer specific 2-hydroxyacid dehydrogenase NAD-binding protein [Coriobacterium glomerans PW2]|uniref:D-isomer specific 2-hydroxyacid dehydrogenase NAD-binding protein n=1 Tax=Coriobacterium glomerans (strain ATCC 49209 / DSM 20642 / JCM 10262 / PW2) TaxID=700015 RepID=F2N8J2_CORGP|nr:2-hydroxyacid dehydrogenase [Coriobacterium glomerans]AEB07375.1 D-isomer specific 2-hydroxyacid dehydrogenase NAD-binding protein [Coriobacterium glomerans PW2]
MKIIVIGDIVVPCELLAEAARSLDANAQIVAVEWVCSSRQEFQRRAQHLERSGPDAEQVPHAVFEAIADADVLLTHFCPVPADLIAAGTRLRLIGTCRGGMEHIDVAAATSQDIPVIHCIRNAEATSDFAIGLMLCETRNIARGHAALKAGEWRKDYVNSGYTTSLSEMTLGLVGLGHIGSLVARKAVGLGMRRVIACDPYLDQARLDAQGLDVKLLSERELFAGADIVSLHLRLTPETDGCIGAQQIGLMKSTAYLVNTSRAGVLDKAALIAALVEHRIGGCALDVFWDEPLAPDDPILALDNVTVTPHNAGNVVDALPKSPILLAKKIQQYWQTGTSDMVVNLEQIGSKRTD